MSKDIEMSCDEAVLRKEGEDIRCDYSSSLLNLSVKKGGLLLTPLAFGESSVKSRIKNVLSFKKPSRVIIAVALVLVAVFSVGFAVNSAGGGVALTDEGDDLISESGSQPDDADTIERNNDNYNQTDNINTPNGFPTSETKYGNTSGNISNGAFVAQDGGSVYYVLPTHLEYQVRMGDLIKTNADGSEEAILFSGDRPHGLNIVDGWIYYITSFDGQIYKMREDGTENTLITTADTQSGLMQGYTTQYLSTVEVMVVVDNYIYCRVRYPADVSDINRIKGICRINLDNGEAERLQQLDAQTSGFYIMAPRGASYYARDYYYFDADGKLQFLISGTFLDILADFNNDGQNEMLWFYHGGRDAVYNYMVGEDIFRFDIIEAISERFVNWENIEIDTLSLRDNTMKLNYWRDDNWHNAQISFTSDSIIVQADFA